MYNLKKLLFALLLANFFLVKTVSPNVFGSNPPTNDNLFFCDRIEINVYCDEWTIPVFAQALFQDWNKQHKIFEIREWRLTQEVFDKTDMVHFTAFKKKWRDYCDKWNRKELWGKQLVAQKFINKWKGSFGPNGPFGWPYRCGPQCYKYQFLRGNPSQIITVIAKYPPKVSFTQYDPERRQREIIPEDMRKKLFVNTRDKNASWYNSDEENFIAIMGGRND